MPLSGLEGPPSSAQLVEQIKEIWARYRKDPQNVLPTLSHFYQVYYGGRAVLEAYLSAERAVTAESTPQNQQRLAETQAARDARTGTRLH